MCTSSEPLTSITQGTCWHVRIVKIQIGLHICTIWSVLVFLLKKRWTLGYHYSVHWRLWSNCADAQTDLSLQWMHVNCTFSWTPTHIDIMFFFWKLREMERPFDVPDHGLVCDMLWSDPDEVMYANYNFERSMFWASKITYLRKSEFEQLLYCFYYSFTLYYCAIFYCLDAGFFQYHRGVKQFGSRSGPTFCRAWSGSKLFAKVIIRQQKSPLVGKEINTKQLVANTLAKVNFIWLHLFPFG